ncbi:hypothetical protein nbrc107696_41780 [Gordonia spumicola]|uniref:Uncharacterized protein n=1 Tax=Gordonia spumicola TaxID=589161 RepID=A0A7I9VEU0_9ACTN|nr:hypothetical protein [Gordonia spumicola]GEE03732.1 hypothetical protein nbrc107696_41780 [Gordonia spumicola]
MRLARAITALGAAALLAGAAAAYADTPDSSASLSSTVMRIYDFTTYGLQFTRPAWGMPNPTDPDGIITARPTGGAVMDPGDYQEVTLTQNIKMHAVGLRYTSQATPGKGVTVQVITSDDSSNNKATIECRGSGYLCLSDGRNTVFVVDDVDGYPASATRTVPAADDETQFDMLRRLCTDTSAASCSFNVGSRKSILSDPTRVSNVYRSDVDWTYSKATTVTSEYTTSVTNGVGADLDKAWDVVSASVEHEYETSTTRSSSYTETITYQVSPGVYFWVEARNPMIRYTGDFRFSLKGKGEIVLKDVYYDVPDPSRKGTLAGITSTTKPVSAPVSPPPA